MAKVLCFLWIKLGGTFLWFLMCLKDASSVFIAHNYAYLKYYITPLHKVTLIVDTIMVGNIIIIPTHLETSFLLYRDIIPFLSSRFLITHCALENAGVYFKF